jgi:hypothetical protein
METFGEYREIVLGQVAVDEKSNEITAIPKLLDLQLINAVVYRFRTQRNLLNAA